MSLVLKTHSYQLAEAISKSAAFSLCAHSHLQKNEIPMAVYMMQQATEHLMRSAIVILTGQQIKKSSITELLQYTAGCAPKINGLFADAANHELLPILDKAYLHARYGKCTITARQLNRLELLVADLLHITEECMKEGLILRSKKQTPGFLPGLI